MAIGSGSTHWQNPLHGGRAHYDEMSMNVLNQRDSWYVFYDFNDQGDADEGATGNWIETLIGATGTAALLPAQPGGILRITSGAVDNAGVGSFQHVPQAAMIPTTADTLSGLPSRIIGFGARVAISDYSVANWSIGIGTVDTTVQLDTGLIATTYGNNFANFYHVAEASTQGGVLGPDGNNVRMASAGGGIANIGVTLLSAAQVPKPVPADAAVDGVFFDYGIRIVGNQDVEFYIDGVLRHARRMPAAFGAGINLLATFTCLCAGGADVNMDIDYVWFGATR